MDTIPHDDFLTNFKIGCSPEQLETIQITENVLDIVEVLITTREKQGLSQQELADAAGVNLSVVVGIETLKVLPKIDMLIRIARPLNVKIFASVTE